MLSTLVCIVSGLLAVFLFWGAHSYLDRSEPLAGPAALALGGIVVLTSVALVVSLPDLAGRRQLVGYAFAVAAPLALPLAFVWTAYDDWFVLLIVGIVLFGLAALSSLVLPLVIVGLVMLFRSRPAHQPRRNRDGFVSAFVLGWGFALAHALASLYLLATLPHQVERARDAHQIPGPAFLAMTAILVGIALWRRRELKNHG